MQNPDDLERQAELLYRAVSVLLHDNKIGGLLLAVADARTQLSWDDAAPKTRDVFRQLAAHLAAATFDSRPRI